MTPLATKLADIRYDEDTADEPRRDIRHRCYRKMLAPELRGEFLGLFEVTDNIIDETRKVWLNTCKLSPVAALFVVQNLFLLEVFR